MLRRHHLEWIVRVLGTFPLVALAGARQVGKSTLARLVIDELGGDYVSLDDIAALSEARADPAGFIKRGNGLVVIDEVQLAPGLLPAIKLEIDRDRRPGRFLVTGSANLLRMRQVTESLAGRSAWLELPPLTWSELLERPRPAAIDAAFDAADARAFVETLAPPVPDHASRARQRAVLGGMPALIGMDEASRALWYDGYRLTFLERDLRRLSRIENVPDFSRLATIALLRSGGLLNRSDLASDAALDYGTAKRYLNILEVGCQVFELTPYLQNVGKRLVKRPKLYATDVGMAAHAANVRSWDAAVAMARSGPLFETWAVNELRAVDAVSSRRSGMHFWRTSAGAEVDLVLERGVDVVGVEVKSSATVRHKETLGMRALRDDLGARFKLGIIAYLGDEARVLDDRLCLIPLGSLLGATI